jgi:hypothetical protein
MKEGGGGGYFENKKNLEPKVIKKWKNHLNIILDPMNNNQILWS